MQAVPTPNVRTFMLAAGGTGGHVYPAIAVAEALVARGHAADAIRFTLDARPANAEAVERAGFGFDVLPLERGFRRHNLRANVAVIGAVARATYRASGLRERYQPRVVIGFGAYAALPLVLAARLARLPVVVHEQNARPGVVNRIAVALGARAATSLPGTPLRGATLTGNPVRPAIVAVKRAPARPPVVAIVGGSLGSAALNELALGLHDTWRDRNDVAIEHVCGARYLDDCRARLLVKPGDRISYRLVGYEHDMPGLYSRATLMITRSGGSVAELAAAGMPAILVPWDESAGGHQAANARTFEEAGAAIAIAERDCTATRVAAESDRLLADPGRLDAMANAAHELARPNAADAVAAMAEAACR
jgi:UDP-N-acetylglucosamine--N-acetylmuramyl-(pentapeptide) pyrophosphoryl-undecaprenol N-acetylglucosamine transferase